MTSVKGLKNRPTWIQGGLKQAKSILEETYLVTRALWQWGVCIFPTVKNAVFRAMEDLKSHTGAIRLEDGDLGYYPALPNAKPPA